MAAIAPEVAALQEKLVAVRRHIHQNPEIGYEVLETAALVATTLRACGVDELRERVGRSGVVALIRGTAPDAAHGPFIALRADMDALPLTEDTNVPYKSQISGRAHACGHDGHVSILLAVAEILCRRKSSLRGSVLLLFQPAEEGGAGARAMVEDRALQLFGNVDEVYGLHLWTPMALNTVGVSDGPTTAFSDRFKIEITGRGGHGSMPHTTVDAIVVMAHLVTTMQTIVSRNIDPCHPAVISFGIVQGGSAPNIISQTCSLQGTIRAFRPDDRARVVERMREVCDGTAAAFGASIIFNYQQGYPACINTPREASRVRRSAEKICAVTDPIPSCAGEDFSFFLQEKPGCFFFVGATDIPTREPIAHHSPHFDFDERALAVAASVFLQLVDDRLSERT
eukprot:gnl/Spiro4/23571_TR11648_c0_g1_i1.p1 gnl/Spiro4/23571_TR11648_c0_g1~~gnl/Spiro4/23571_TR11648_c0_g1_i1.p1  ORF type:complete len:397 (+),score=98.77 gnl/Spiro4/23571_TR11648_c0_g1_i1:65-1255(+)